MNDKVRSLVDAANVDFNGATPDDLQRYCEELSIPTRSNTTDSWRLVKLREAIGAGAHKGVLETQVQAPRNIAGKRLNLLPGGRWEGRRRVVNLNESEDDIASPWKEISWDGSTILVRTGMDVAIPYPHYEILKNAIHVVLQRKQVTKDGQTYIDETEKRLRVLQFADVGDDPATKDLPRSFIERAQGECRERNYYKGGKREHMARLMDELTDRQIPRERTREMSDEEIREQIMNKLGLYEEVQETDFALDNAA